MKETNFFTKQKDNIFAMLSNDIGIDLGTANILVYLKGVGIVVDEPSVVAINKKTERVIAVGFAAKEMLGRTPEHILVERPIVDGVIANFEIAGEMMAYLINKVESEFSKKFTLFGPRVVVGVPSGITNVESRAARDAAINAGAREVQIVEEPLAAAIGAGLPVKSAKGTIIIDIGGGTTDIAVISLGGIVNSKKLLIAGDKLNSDISDYLKNKHKLLVGENSAEELKINVGSVNANKERKGKVRGRDLVSGLAREIELDAVELKAALKSSIDGLVEGIKEVIETTPPEILSEASLEGIYLSGGGAMIDGLAPLIEKELKMPVKTVDEPFLAVVNGTAVILDNIDEYKESILFDEDEIKF